MRNTKIKHLCLMLLVLALSAIVLATICAVVDPHAGFGEWLARWSSFFLLLFLVVAGLSEVGKKIDALTRMGLELRRSKHYHLHNGRR